MKFRKKPVVVDAVQWKGTRKSLQEIYSEFGDNKISYRGNHLIIITLEGLMTAKKKDWIIKGVEGEIYPCKPGIFEKTYDLIK